ncbi:methionyl-tRNA formyltransferase [Lachnospiraceae bacterium ZAX-1]
MNVIFMGTPDFSVGTLEALLTAGHSITLVVTQPDKPKGRGHSMQYTPVKETALAHGLPVYQPLRVGEADCIKYLKNYPADIIVVVAFGQILPKGILDMPKYGCVNVHASLLPKYRGAAPIQWTVINGDEVAGVTTMRMDEGLDTGDMILTEEVVLDQEETAGTLFDKLSEKGAKLCVKTLEMIQNQTAVFTPQEHEKATHTTRIKKQMGEIDWKRPAAEIERLIRGLNPWPSAYTKLDGKTLKIWKADVVYELEGMKNDTMAAANGMPGNVEGTITKITKDGIYVQTGTKTLALKEIQLEGKKRMGVSEFLRGYLVKEGIILT